MSTVLESSAGGAADPAEAAFVYRDGGLQAEQVPLARIAEAVGTPCYVYAGGAMQATYRALASALGAVGLPTTICYAVKANPHVAVIRGFAALGAGADVVSEGELRRALAAGVPPERIVFAGVGKTEAEMAFALETGILQFNAESIDELKVLDAVAGRLGRTAPVALRVNPDVDARTHAKIATGKAGNKFGIDIDQMPATLALLRDLKNLRLDGLAVHIGSQLVHAEPYEAAFARLAELAREVLAGGWRLRHLDLGGGMGIPYGPARDGRSAALPLDAYVAAVKRTVGSLGLPLVFEPGRYLVGNAGLLLARVLYVKQGRSKRFVILDAAMNDLIRPTLYDAWHEIVPVAEPAPGAALEPVDVVGPICESGDIFAHDRLLPPVAPGDLIAILSTGAYGATMSSTYNSRLPAPEVMVRGGDSAVIKARPDHAAMIAQDRLPAWLEESGRTR
ncbi:diaminopimelate decarboxylase [Tistlia consotensis]|uniref:Diaminopimelate decarboxylase n=1 Tax=Tistlia consotensis USBA 355 TaxID=560819 RepID=A0A1Y6BB54_9PROT|nr:diaminopimelate decarboxylase [Tistlia consotensis]SME91592.1 diaminopimelate decarboxylase [Tistlia consotensis USBA 355]SNR27477.1 diaminopimelate decarboxylase [Tistlia consotensis]